uniref:Neuritin 1 n=1 Tax=Vombatus ursinus TaxID=29139 RepID=A0A4X2K0J8_VOMUR
MGLKLNGRYISLILAVQIAYLVQSVRAAGKCDAVFKGFSDCLLKLGDSMANYPQGLDDKTNIKTVCAKTSNLFAEATVPAPRDWFGPDLPCTALFDGHSPELSGDTGRISTAAPSQPLRIARKGRKICGIN